MVHQSQFQKDKYCLPRRRGVHGYLDIKSGIWVFSFLIHHVQQIFQKFNFSLLFPQKIFSSLVRNILQNLNRVKLHGGHFQHQMVCIFPQQRYVTGNPDLVCVNNMDKMG